MLLSFCLIFCQFQPDVAYKSVAYKKACISQDKFLDLFNLVLKIISDTFDSNFSQQTDGVAIGGLASSNTAEIFMQLHEKLQYLRHYTLQKFGSDLLMTFVPFLNVHTWKFFFITSTIFIKTESLLWRKKVMEN